MAPQAAPITVRGAALSLQAVHNVAHGAPVELDPAWLEALRKPGSKGLPAVLPRNSFPVDGTTDGASLTEAEVKSVLFVLLHKLVQGSLQAGLKIRPVVPLFLVKVLNSGSQFAFTDLVSIVQFLYGLNEAELDVAAQDLRKVLVDRGVQEFDLTKDEWEAIQACNAVAVGKAALAVYNLSPVPVIADVVAAVSCEALGADVRTFEEGFPEGGPPYRAAADVASALRTLLAGSKLVNPRKGATSGDIISSIPAVHASFRGSLKLCTDALVAEINWPAGSPTSSVFLLDESVASLWRSLQRLTSISVGRLQSSIHSLGESSPQKVLCKALKDYEVADRPSGTAALSTFGISTELKAADVIKVLQTLAIEAGVSLALLASLLAEKETSRKGLVTDGSKPNGELSREGLTASSEKKKKGGPELLSGKGTTLVRQVFTRILQERLQPEVDRDWFDLEWSACLLKFFQPDDRGLQDLFLGVKAFLESNEARRLPKIPKGTRDFGPRQMAVREKAFSTIQAVFKRHGAVALETPVFELRETLMGKYGEDSKLIYDLADQGGEKSSLRYDLTVPFARYLAMNSISSMKRYHIAKVYRRDNPSRGRYREFYQCDFDVAGQYALMVPDFEVLKVLTELLDELNIGQYVVKLNHRRLLDAMLEISGVPASKFRSICSAIDKLDKSPWEQVRKEMVEEKGLTEETADKIGLLVQKQGEPGQLLAELKQVGSDFLQHTGAASALDELSVLFKYMEAGKCLHRFVFDLSLARGLDYYTGVIFEAVFKGSVQVGSIAAGGRYDNLVGMFSGKQVPAVGMSLGIERVLAILEEDKKTLRERQTQVLVIAIGKEKWDLAIKIANDLWFAKIEAEFVSCAPSKIANNFKSADADRIPWVVTVGESELERGIVKLKNMEAKEEEEVDSGKLVELLQARITE